MPGAHSSESIQIQTPREGNEEHVGKKYGEEHIVNKFMGELE